MIVLFSCNAVFAYEYKFFQRVGQKEKIHEIEDKGVSWLEPARTWVKSLNQADRLLSSGDKSEMTTFLKQIGSNHILIDKSFSFSPKKPFQILAKRRVSRGELTSSNLHFPNWRKWEDSNLRYRFRYTAFRVRPIQPLWHTSID